MTVTLVVETSDLAAAAHALDDRVGQRLWAHVGSALSEAMSCTGMAGDDPAGLEWAEAYEQAASAAAQAAQDVTNGAFTLAALLAATAQNYARADAASTAGVRRAVADVVARLPGPTTITFATRFAGVGGGPPDAPWGWSHVEHYARVLWPNGHQDRLRRAGEAWSRSARVLSSAAQDVDSVLDQPLVDGLPEGPDIRDACLTLGGHLRDVAEAHRRLAHSCEQFAHDLDVAHSRLYSRLRTFLIETGAIEVGGNILVALSWGALELPVQGIEGTRIGVTIAEIVKDVGELAAAVRDLVAALPTVTQVCSAVATTMRELLSVRIVWADVDEVPGLLVLSVADDGRTAGAAADLTHLADDATLPTELRAALDSPRCGEWNDTSTLSKHFDDHGTDFGAASQTEYANRAGAFLRRAIEDRLPMKVDGHGIIRVFDPETNTFGSYTADGATRTFFKPSSPTYWQRQKGELLP
ncbi:hypothetical protein [Jatrophihabitans endophyticus]|uniref:WXG100-like domain-containing protein n=1 Tax=Jatrophihabitans endophyticus TaxID=1206085 RepID=UPI0019DEA294|nr:hypothetical protein [Jatrophihabitans endophyticus]MBE7189100.1 hypothetical protein [Jatrophihabitans endophyticus]